jgi:hypothetical protein
VPSRVAGALAFAALALFASTPAKSAFAAVTRVHVCGSDRTIPLPVPAKKGSDGTASCHGSAAVPGDKKRGRPVS